MTLNHKKAIIEASWQDKESLEFEYPCGFTGHELYEMPESLCDTCRLAFAPPLLPILQPIPLVNHCVNYWAAKANALERELKKRPPRTQSLNHIKAMTIFSYARMSYPRRRSVI